jgi:NAD(P)-dependent dehydrogenase (short-subunit alcohol dehydrogenase family)
MTQEYTLIVTGAGAGIGRALAIGFAQSGVRVVGVGRTAASLKETKALCGNYEFSYKLADVSNPRETTEAFAEVLEESGQIDGLICNAAVYPRIHFLDQPEEEWTRTLLINVCGVANCCRAVLPGMLERNQGRIVVIGSLADWNPISASSAYSASKGALHGLVRAIASEIDRERYPDVLINEFSPSATRTGMSDYGDDPVVVYERVKRLMDFPTGGPSGRLYYRDKELRPPEGVKAKAKRVLSHLLNG